MACGCGTEKKTVIEALGHDEEAHEVKAPTYTEKGWDAYAICSRQGSRATYLAGNTSCWIIFEKKS